jgi:hypothetical protein
MPEMQFWSHFVVLSQLNKLTPEAVLLNKSSFLGAALGVTKFDRIFAITLVTLSCAILVRL